eukprot:gene12615-6520_t
MSEEQNNTNNLDDLFSSGDTNSDFLTLLSTNQKEEELDKSPHHEETEYEFQNLKQEFSDMIQKDDVKSQTPKEISFHEEDDFSSLIQKKEKQEDLTDELSEQFSNVSINEEKVEQPQKTNHQNSQSGSFKGNNNQNESYIQQNMQQNVQQNVQQYHDVQKYQSSPKPNNSHQQNFISTPQPQPNYVSNQQTQYSPHGSFGNVNDSNNYQTPNSFNGMNNSTNFQNYNMPPRNNSFSSNQQLQQTNYHEQGYQQQHQQQINFSTPQQGYQQQHQQQPSYGNQQQYFQQQGGQNYDQQYNQNQNVFSYNQSSNQNGSFGHSKGSFGNSNSFGAPSSLNQNNTILTPPQKNFLKDPEKVKIIKDFPGPLNEKTNLQQLLGYIHERSETITFNPSEKQLWKLLSVFIRGGTDEDDLIVQILRILETKEIDSWTNENETKNTTGFIPRIRTEEDQEKDVQTLENLLSKGEIEGGCEFAMQNGLWGHAFLLASMIDKQTFQKVVLNFSQTSFVGGAPIQTLYLMFADKANLTFQNTKNFEDWRKNLSIVLANRAKSFSTIVETLGQKLWKDNRDASSSHFCYLITDYFSNKLLTQNVLLVGGDHIFDQDNFITPEAIQRTEIYEFYKKKKNPNFVFPKFQEYKFKYATWLLELGDPQRAYDYCQIIKQTVEKNQGAFPQKFVHDLFMMDKKLASNPKLVKLNVDGKKDSSSGGWFGQTLTNWMHGDSDKVNQQQTEKGQINQSQTPQRQQTQSQQIQQVSNQKVQEQPPQPKENKQNVEEDGSSGGSWFGWLGFGGGKPKGNVNLGKSLNQGFVFDKKLGVWHKPGETPDPNKNKVKPPPMMSTQSPQTNNYQQQISNMPGPSPSPNMMNNMNNNVNSMNNITKGPEMGAPPSNLMPNATPTRGGYIDIFNTGGGNNQKNQNLDDLQLSPFNTNVKNNLPPPVSFFNPQSQNQNEQQKWQNPTQNYQ